MKVTRPPLPSPDKRWKIIDTKMRKLGYRPSALIEAMHATQDAFGYLDETALKWIAQSLRIPPSRVYGVATFYNFFTLNPQGAHKCVVCLGTACYVKGSNAILRAIEEYARIRQGQTTRDGQLSLLTARCIGACAIAPAVIYDGKIAGNLNPGQAIDKLKGAMTHAA